MLAINSSKCIVLLIMLIISNTLKGQNHFRQDLLVWGDDSLIVVSKPPLKEYFNRVNVRNWGQYGDKGIWKIKSDSLFLIKVDVSPFIKKKNSNAEIEIPIGYAKWYTGKIIATRGDILRKGGLVVIFKSEQELLIEKGYIKEKHYYNNTLKDTNRVNRNSLSILNGYIQERLNNCVDIRNYLNIKDTLIFVKYEFSIDVDGKIRGVVVKNEDIVNYELLNEAIISCFYEFPDFEIIQKRDIPITEYFIITVKVNLNSFELFTILQWSMWNEFKTKPTSR